MSKSFFYSVGVDIPKQLEKEREISWNNTVMLDKSKDKLLELSEKFLE